MGTCSTGDSANTDPECPPALLGQERGMVTRPRGRCQLAPGKGGRDRRSGVAGAIGGKKTQSSGDQRFDSHPDS